jgi:hypothetical protein
MKHYRISIDMDIKARSQEEASPSLNLRKEDEPMANNAGTNSAQEPLPPDPDGMNDKRASWAGSALAVFMRDTSTEDEDALGDLLADLMHWCDRNNYDFDAALERAHGHYEAETLGEGAA